MWDWNNAHLFLTILEAEKSKITMSADLVPIMGFFILGWSFPLFIKLLIHQGHSIFMTSSKSNHFLKIPPHNIIKLNFGAHSLFHHFPPLSSFSKSKIYLVKKYYSYGKEKAWYSGIEWQDFFFFFLMCMASGINQL